MFRVRSSLAQDFEQTLFCPLILSLPLARAENGWPVVIEEDIAEGLRKALAFAGEVVDAIDPTQRLTHVVVAATLGALAVMRRASRWRDSSRKT